MISFLFEETLLERLSKWNIITGLVLAAVALVLMCLSRIIIRRIFKNKTEEQQAVYTLRFKMISAALAVAGLMLAVLIP